MRIRVYPAVFGAALRLASRSLPLAALVASALCTAPRSAEATLAREITLRQLVLRSHLAVVAVPEEATTVWEDSEGGGKRIVTYTRLTISEIVFGATGASAPKDVWVRSLGGVVGEIGQRVEGEVELRVGERSLLFLHSRGDGTHTVIDMAQGHFPVAVAEVPGVEGTPVVPRLRLSPHLGGLVKQATAEPLARVALRDKPVVEAIKLLREERRAAGL